MSATFADGGVSTPALPSCVTSIRCADSTSIAFAAVALFKTPCKFLILLGCKWAFLPPKKRRGDFCMLLKFQVFSTFSGYCHFDRMHGPETLVRLGLLGDTGRRSRFNQAARTGSAMSAGVGGARASSIIVRLSAHNRSPVVGRNAQYYRRTQHGTSTLKIFVDR